MRKDQVFMLVVVGALLTCTTAFAQAPKSSQPTAPVGSSQSVSPTEDLNARPPFCDEVTKKVVDDLQQSADKSCQTVSTCVRCLDRATGVDLYATLYAQPKMPKCNVATAFVYDKKQVMQERALRIYYEVLQSVCTREGVNLEVSFPYARIDPSQYEISWEVDGRAIGKGTQASCVCGKSATVTVVEKSSGKLSKKSMSLATACSSTAPSKN